MLQLCAGLKNMHNLDPPYAHNDVKPGNVLLTHRKGQSPLAILMDFGSARPARKQIRSRSEALQLQVIIFYSLPFPFTLFWIIISYSFILIFHQYYFQQPF
jgi:serine/threonine protein kinase